MSDTLTKQDMKQIIYDVYNFDTHIDSDKHNAISTTTLIGSAYKAKKYLEKAPKDSSFIENKLKRSSTIGTSVHSRFELALQDDKTFVLEQYREREIMVEGVTYVISGACDGLKQDTDGSWIIYDIKTGYGAKFKNEDSAKKQLSIYRWLLQDEYNINDTGYVLFVSVTNNDKEAAIPLQLMSLEETQDYIEAKLDFIVHNENVDCANTSYNSCSYCSYLCQHRQ